MRKRAIGLLAAIFGSAVAGLPLAAVSQTAAPADDCLAAPDSQPLPGSHWRYRVDRATNRQCWYARSDDPQVAPVARPARPAALLARPALQRSIANARAEVSATAEASDNAGGPTIESIVGGGDVSLMPSPSLRALAGRRSEYAMARADAAPSMISPGARHRPQPASARQAGRSSASASDSIRTLLMALGGALAMAIGTSALITKFGRKAIGRTRKRGRARTIWTAQPAGETSAPAPTPVQASVRQRDEASVEWVRSAHQAQETSRQAEQIEQLLSRAARRSA